MNIDYDAQLIGDLMSYLKEEKKASRNVIIARLTMNLFSMGTHAKAHFPAAFSEIQDFNQGNAVVKGFRFPGFSL